MTSSLPPREPLPPWARPQGTRERPLELRYARPILSRAGRLEAIVLEGGPPLDRALEGYLRENRQLGSNDRRLLAAAVYRLARNRELYRRALPGRPPGTGAYLLLALADAPEVGQQGTEALAAGDPKLAARLRAAAELRLRWARAVAGAWDRPPAELDEATAEAAARLFSVPPWWLALGPWRTLGEAAEELSALRRPLGATLRVQLHRAGPGGRDEVLARLRREGISAEPTRRSPWGIRLEGRPNLKGSELYRRGWVEVQDEGSQLIAWAAAACAGARVLDLCAGGGGKALALASVLEGQGRVTAYDVDARRLRETARRAERSGLARRIRVVSDARELERGAPFDLVLADAPCTGSGTLRRNPDAAWRWSREALGRFTGLQDRILDRAARLVAPGGSVLYATCSLLEPENRCRVEAFLGRHPAFRPAPLGPGGPEDPLGDLDEARAGALRLPPTLDRYDGDAFFLARLRREG
ncbi:MAG: RsmB/NOP family class I SAM-dependent RNA methyltransferase [Deferrisomatales bacterium]